MKIESDSHELIYQIDKSISWPIRLLAPRRISIRLFAFLTGSVCLLMAFSVGLGLGIAYDQLGWQVSIVTALMLSGWAVAMIFAIVIDRFTSSRLVTRNTAVRQLILNLLSYCGGASIGAVFSLYLRTVIPTLYPPRFPPFSLSANLSVISIVAVLWLILGLISNHLVDRTLKQKEYQTALVKSNLELKQSRKRILAAQEAVRQRIAESLHCTVNDLFSLSLKLECCRDKAHSSPDILIPELNRIKRELDRLINEDLRNAIKDLRPGVLKVGLPDALRAIFDRFGKRIKIRIFFDEYIKQLEDPAKPSLPDDIRLALYRFAEEAVRNVIKHADASEITLSLKVDTHRTIELVIQDNGKGISTGSLESTGGISLMRYGIETCGGIFTIESSSQQGTKMTARIPLQT